MIILITILTIYVAVTFREPLPKPLPNDTTYATGFPLGANKLGYGSIFSLPVSLMSATIFSEAMWQKVSAASATTCCCCQLHVSYASGTCHCWCRSCRPPSSARQKVSM